MSVKILQEPRSNGSRGPLPMQLDWLDHRMREASGGKSSKIPFQRPGWVSGPHWEAFRKAVDRKSSYTETVTVLPTLKALRRYIRHLESNALAEQVAKVLASKKLFAVPEKDLEETDDLVLLRGLSEIELRQHVYYRAKGWLPWVLTEQRGTNIVVLKTNLKAFVKAWKAVNKEHP